MTSRHESSTKRRSRLWYLLPIFLSIVGGVIAYFVLKGNDPITARNTLWVGVILAAAATVAFLAIYASYNSEVGTAREQVLAGSKVIETARGPIEYTTYGQGSPVLVIHGAGGGYDQGLVTAKDGLVRDTSRSYLLDLAIYVHPYQPMEMQHQLLKQTTMQPY
jgi:hypothetical protein